MKKGLVFMFLLVVSSPLFCQKIPESFWNAPLNNSHIFSGCENDIPVKAFFRDTDFYSKTQLDGTIITSKISSIKMKGNTIFIRIDTISDEDVISSIIWQLTYYSTEKGVGIESIEVIDPTSEESFKMELSEYKVSGDSYKQYLLTIMKILNTYYDTEKIGKMYK
jgi:hypothetical protein